MTLRWRGIITADEYTLRGGAYFSRLFLLPTAAFASKRARWGQSHSRSRVRSSTRRD
jgi:hypothetical protein